MTKYKIKVSIDGENFFWVVVSQESVIWIPTEEDFKGTKFKCYSKTNICPICREENNITDKSILFPGNVLRRTDKNGKKIDELICRRHGWICYNRYNSNSRGNIIKSLADHRTRNLVDPIKIFGDNCEEVTKKWLGVKRLSIEYDNYKLPFDHSPIPKGVSTMIGIKLVDLSGNIPQTKGAKLTILKLRMGLMRYEYERWGSDFTNDINKNFDLLIFYCVSEDGKIIERLYIFPREEVINRTGINIYKVMKGGPHWYEKYRVKDEKVLEYINEIWKKIITNQ